MVAPVWDGRERDNEIATTTVSVVSSSLQHPIKFVAYDSRGCPTFCAHCMTLQVSSVFCDTFCNDGSEGNNPHILNLDTSQR